MALKIGINPLTWTNDDMPELGGDTPLETCLAEAKQAGYDGVELGNKFPREAGQLRPVLARHGLDLVSGWYSGRLLERSPADEMMAVEGHLALLAAMGCTTMVFAEVSGCVHGERKTKLSQRPRLDNKDWRRLADGLNTVAKHLRKRGVHMAYHHHMGTVIETGGCGPAPRRPHRARSLQGHPPRRAGQGEAAGFELPRCRARRRVHRAG
jgi:inosose dehydratase